MKKLFTLLLIAGALSCSAQDKAGATVETFNGLLIYHLSKPTQPFEVLGTVKQGIAWTGQPGEMLKGMTKEALKKYPGAEGVIFNTELDRGEVIKFK